MGHDWSRSLLFVLSIALSTAVFGPECRGDETAGGNLLDLAEEDELLRNALRNYSLKSGDPEAYYSRIDEILSETTADPDAVIIIRGFPVEEGDPPLYGDIEAETYLSDALDAQHPDFRLANLLLSHGADPRFEPNGRSSALEATIVSCDALALALLRLHGAQLTRTERYLALGVLSPAFEGLLSWAGLDPVGDCPATRLVADMTLEELVAWLHFPAPYSAEHFLSLYADGLLDELKRTPKYPEALEAAKKAGKRMPSRDEAWVRAGLAESRRVGVERAAIQDRQGLKESMAPSRGGSEALPAANPGSGSRASGRPADR